MPAVIAHGLTRKIAVRRLVMVGVIRRELKTANIRRLRRTEWEAIDALKRHGERPIIRETQRLFEDQEREVIQRLEQLEAEFFRSELGEKLHDFAIKNGHGNGPRFWAFKYAIKNGHLEIERIFDIGKWDREVLSRFTPEIRHVLEEGFTAGLQRVGIEGPSFSSADPEVLATIRQIANKTKDINATTARQLSKLINDALPEIENMNELTALVAKKFRRYRGPRAAMIGETIGTGGFEAGQRKAFKDAGIDGKGWLSQRDGRVRRGKYDHWNADGQIVGIDEPFLVSGEKLQHPADPAGSAGNVIRCRCTTTPEDLPEDETVEPVEPETAEPVAEPELEPVGPEEFSSTRARATRAAILERGRTRDEMQANVRTVARQMAQFFADDPRAEELRREWRKLQREVDAYDRETRKEVVKLVSGKRKPSKFAVDWQAENRDVVAGMDQIDFVKKLVKAKRIDNGTLVVNATRGGSYYDPDTNNIYISRDQQPGVYAHEAAHWLEDRLPSMLMRAKAFFDHRTAGDQVGDLRDAGYGYDRYVPYKPDRWRIPYIGRVYEREDGRTYATEITSMGVQWLYKDAVDLARSDPEYFEFIITQFE